LSRHRPGGGSLAKAGLSCNNQPPVAGPRPLFFFPCEFSKNRRMGATDIPYYHVFMGMQIYFSFESPQTTPNTQNWNGEAFPPIPLARILSILRFPLLRVAHLLRAKSQKRGENGKGMIGKGMKTPVFVLASSRRHGRQNEPQINTDSHRVWLSAWKTG
jgi:hypothetical protein